MSNKYVDLMGVHVRPIPKELFETVLCTNCRKHAARWEFAEGAHQAWVYSCSGCLLYEVPQLKGQRTQVDFLISQVEKAALSVLSKDSEGRLVLPNDADRIAFGVVMAQRFMQSRTLSGGFNP